LNEFISVENPRVADALRLIAVSDYRSNHHLDLVMDAQKSYAVAFLVREDETEPTDNAVVRGNAPSSFE
jgi:hypothetical protein